MIARDGKSRHVGKEREETRWAGGWPAERNENYRIYSEADKDSERAATNTLVRGPLLGKSSRLRLIPVVRKEAKGSTAGARTGEPTERIK